MIRTLDRLVAATFIKIFVAAVCAVPLIFTIIEYTDRQNELVNRGVSFAQAMHGYLFQLPQFIIMGAPIAALIATVFTIQGMTTHREILAAKASGMSFHRTILPIMPVGLGMTVGCFLLGPLAAEWNRRSAEILGDRELRNGVRTDFVFELDDGSTLSAGMLNVGGRSLDRVVIESAGGDGALHHLWASRASHEVDEGWTLHYGRKRIVRPDGGETAFAFETLRQPELNVLPEELIDDPPDDRELGYAELGRRAEALERSGGDADELWVRQGQKLSIPAAMFVIIIFGAPLATSVKKAGPSVGIGLSLSSTILYLLLLRLFGAAGAAGVVPPFWAAWAPNMFFMAAGLVLLARVRT